MVFLFGQTTSLESGSPIPVKASGKNLWGDSRKSVDHVSEPSSNQGAIRKNA